MSLSICFVIKGSRDMDKTLKHCFIKELYKGYGVWISVFDQNGGLLDFAGPNDASQLSFIEDNQLYGLFQENRCSPGKVCLYTDSERFLYGTYANHEGTIYLCGPATVVKDRLGQSLAFYRRYGCHDEGIDIPYISYGEMNNLMAILYMGIEQRPLEDSSLMISGQQEINVSVEELNHYIYEQAFEEKQRFGRQMEDTFCRCVEMGDIEALEAYRQEADADAMDKMGDFARSNKKKTEYMFATSLALTRTAAVRGGMNYLESCDLSDIYLRKLEQCGSSDDVLRLMEQMENDYIQHVHTLRNTHSRNSYIECCKNILSRQITRPFDRKVLAERTGLNPDYLSTLFRETEGMTLTEYHRKKRLHAAENLLKYSEYSIADIAQRFCFASASSFSNYFKKEYGVTPLQFRRENKSEAFI